jgi:Putative beta barrel porin-7 (BBP7)
MPDADLKLPEQPKSVSPSTIASQPAPDVERPHEQLPPGYFAAPGCKTSWAFTGGLEYILWFLADSKVNPTVASSDFLSNPGATALGSVGDGESVNRAPISGGRLTLGYWQIEDNPWIRDGVRDFGVEAVFLVIGQVGKTFANDDSPVIVRPFFDLNDRTESGFVVAAPGLATGEINVHAQANLWGGEANVWKNLYFKYPGSDFTLAGMVGFRFLSGDDELQISSTTLYNTNLLPSSPFFPFAGSRLDVVDSFSTHNRFYGAQAGIASKCYIEPNVWFEGDLKLALGMTTEDLNIAGSQLLTMPNGTSKAFTGGVLALPSNIGSFRHDQFAQVPELDGKIGWAVQKHLTLSLGCTVMYWSRIARAGEQIDRQIDITQIPNFPLNAGATPTALERPSVPYAQSDLWAVGCILGAEVKW